MIRIENIKQRINEWINICLNKKIMKINSLSCKSKLLRSNLRFENRKGEIVPALPSRLGSTEQPKLMRSFTSKGELKKSSNLQI